MKHQRALLLSSILVITLCGASGVWLHRERQQYDRNRALIAALVRNDTTRALALVNEGADPNTRVNLPLAPSLKLLMAHLLHHDPAPVNDSPTAFMIACGTDWIQQYGGSYKELVVEENLPLLQAMLVHGANVNARTTDKQTALHAVAKDTNLLTLRLLLSHGADVNAQDAEGATALMKALPYDSENAAPLLASGAQTNLQDQDGNTALLYALKKQLSIDTPVGVDKNIILQLLAHGANPNLRNKEGETPLHLAQDWKRSDIVRLLKQHGAR